jgi:hypothetical protein
LRARGRKYRESLHGRVDAANERQNETSLGQPMRRLARSRRTFFVGPLCAVTDDIAIGPMEARSKGRVEAVGANCDLHHSSSQRAAVSSVGSE